MPLINPAYAGFFLRCSLRLHHMNDYDYNADSYETLQLQCESWREYPVWDDEGRPVWVEAQALPEGIWDY